MGAEESSQPVGEASRARPLLVVEDNDVSARQIVRFFERLCPVRRTATVAESLEVLGEMRSLCGAVIDVKLPDGSGLDVADILRMQDPYVPILVFTGHADPGFVNRAQALRAEYVCKPAELDNLEAFSSRVIVREHYADDRIAQVITHLVRTRGVSAVEAQLITFAVRGLTRSEMAVELAVGPNSIKTYVRRLLRKCDVPTLDMLVRNVLREVASTSEE